ncbi:hypothetical protein N7475_009907 [Penicillium sp. IBT 31633x]|nr:hypothetical protein N7475_009907 [Penicillium sp. IBT 31633x]
MKAIKSQYKMQHTPTRDRVTEGRRSKEWDGDVLSDIVKMSTNVTSITEQEGFPQSVTMLWLL